VVRDRWVKFKVDTSLSDPPYPKKIIEWNTPNANNFEWVKIGGSTSGR
jgi:hypothetical protein